MKIKLVTILVSLALLLGIFGAQAPTAHAARHDDIRLRYNTNLRPTPNTDHAPLTVMPAGSQPDYLCFVHSQSVSIGEGYTDLWFKVRFDGFTGYYSSVFDNVPLQLQQNINLFYGIEDCRLVGQNNDPPVWYPQNTTFDRSASANWALAHAQDRQPFTFSACTWFVSQALWQGGFTQSDGWNNVERHGSLGYLPGTSSATSAPLLIEYLQSHYSISEINLDLVKVTGNHVPEAQPGDIIAYSWDVADDDWSKFTIDHLAIVTNIVSGDYPEVSEWGTVDAPNYFASYAKRGFTYSVNDHTWLHNMHPHVKAKLFHFNM